MGLNRPYFIMKTEIHLEKFPDEDLDKLYQMVCEAILQRRSVKMPDINSMYNEVRNIVSRPERTEKVDARRVNHKIEDIMKDLELCVDAIEGITSQSDFESDIPSYIRKKYEL